MSALSHRFEEVVTISRHPAYYYEYGLQGSPDLPLYLSPASVPANSQLRVDHIQDTGLLFTPAAIKVQALPPATDETYRSASDRKFVKL